jgi:hypothetical protein
LPPAIGISRHGRTAILHPLVLLTILLVALAAVEDYLATLYALFKPEIPRTAILDPRIEVDVEPDDLAPLLGGIY